MKRLISMDEAKKICQDKWNKVLDYFDERGMTACLKLLKKWKTDKMNYDLYVNVIDLNLRYF